MTRFEATDLQHVARLLKIAVDPNEQDVLTDAIREKMTDIDARLPVYVEGAPEATHVRAHACALRSDDVGESLPRAEMLANAPAIEDGLFQVPRLEGR